MAQLFPSHAGTTFIKWNWHYYSRVTLVWLRLACLFPSNTGTILPKWHWVNCFQVRLAKRLFPSEIARLLPKNTGTIVTKTLTRLFLSGFWLSNLQICLFLDTILHDYGTRLKFGCLFFDKEISIKLFFMLLWFECFCESLSDIS